MNNSPSENGSNGGRGPRGRFTVGNPGGPGSGVARKTAQFRAKLFSSVKIGDFAEIVKVLIKEAKAGESWAVKLFLEYMAGPPRDVDLEERLTALEERMLKGR